MWQVFWLLFYKLLFVIAGGIVALIVVRLALRQWAKRSAAKGLHAAGKRCICGYDLAGLPVPRCPECGRAIGFDKTFEELGISTDELRPRQPPQPPLP